MFRHPKYYKELRKRALDERNRERVIICSAAPNTDQAISLRARDGERERASWSGPQATSFKRQAHRSSSNKRQASSSKAQASSLKPQATSSLILDPRKSFKHPEPRCSMQMNVLLGWRMWNAIWCGENRILLPFVTFSSIVKKCPELL